MAENIIHLPRLKIPFSETRHRLDWPAATSTSLCVLPSRSFGQGSCSTATCIFSGSSAELWTCPSPCASSAPSVTSWQTGGLASGIRGTDSLQSGVTPIPSLHNLTAPKTAHSRSQLFEVRLSSHPTQLHDFLLRICLSLHVGLISFSECPFKCFRYIYYPPTLFHALRDTLP